MMRLRPVSIPQQQVVTPRKVEPKGADWLRPVRDEASGLDTSGDTVALPKVSAMVAGGVQGYALGGLAGATAGGVGSYLGQLVGEKTHSKVAGVASGTFSGALLGAGIQYSLQVVAGGTPTVTGLALSALTGAVSGLGGGLASLPGGSGALSAGTIGAFSLGHGGLLAGSVGNACGVQVGKRSGSNGLAIAAGVAGGAASFGAFGAIQNALSGEAWTSGLPVAVIGGGLLGLIGTMGGSRKAATRDSIYGGSLTGSLIGSMSGQPGMMLAGAAGAGVAGTAPTYAGRLVLGAGTGLATGAVTALGTGNWTAVLQSAGLGALAAGTGSVVGSGLQQVVRNGQYFGVRAINEKVVDPYLEKNRLNRPQKIALGAALGGVTLAGLGMLGGWQGVAVMGSVGAGVGAIKMHNVLKQQERDQDTVGNS